MKPKENRTPLEFDIKTGQFSREYKQGVVATTKTEDIEPLAADLRSGDLKEIRYYEAKDGLTVLKESVTNAKICFTLSDLDGLPAAMFGVGWTKNPRAGRVWLLSSEYLYKIGRPFLLECPSYIDLFMHGHDLIFNHVHDGNIASIKWLEWLGFEATSKFPAVGEHKQPFTEYSKFASPAVKNLYLNRDWNTYISEIDKLATMRN